MLALLLASFSSNAQIDLPFAGGEKVEYIIHYKCGTKTDIGAVNVSLTEKTDASKPYYYVRADIATYKFWDTFYKVRDTYETKFYSDNLRPFYATRDVHEGDFWAKYKYTWTNGSKTLRAIVDKKTRPHRDTTFTCPGPIRDLFNLIFTCRAVDVNRMLSGKVACYYAAMDKDLLDIRMKYLGKEVRKISGAGSFNTLKFAISVDAIDIEKVPEKERNLFTVSIDESNTKKEDNVFYGNGKIFIWLTDDENHIPLYFSAPVAVGSINGRLGKVSGLKYPLTSKID